MGTFFVNLLKGWKQRTQSDLQILTRLRVRMDLSPITTKSAGQQWERMLQLPLVISSNMVSSLSRSSTPFFFLIPKSDNPKTPGDFRPISLINELYKIIVRIISYQLQKIMEKIINPCQSAFIPGRLISNNILLSHDLLKSYHFDKGPPRMCLKIDLSKAFNRVSLDFLENAMRYLNFRRKLISWIVECIRKLDQKA